MVSCKRALNGKNDKESLEIPRKKVTSFKQILTCEIACEW